MTISTFAIALMVSAHLAAGPASQLPPWSPPQGTIEASPPSADDLAAQALADGQSAEALVRLQRTAADHPDDPAVLINLGIAYAQEGQDAEARDAFAAALASDQVVELETAGGAATDSRRLARKALKMLKRGEFRTAAGREGQLTYRN